MRRRAADRTGWMRLSPREATPWKPPCSHSRPGRRRPPPSEGEMRGGIEKPPDSPTWRPHRALLILRLPPPSWRGCSTPPPARVNKGEAGRAKERERTGAAAPSPCPSHTKASQRRPPARSNAIITPALRMRGERGTAPRLHLPPPSSGQKGSLPKPRYFLPLPTRGGAGGCPGRWGRPHLCEG